MSGGNCLTQQGTIMKNWPAAIDELKVATVSFGTILPQITTNRTHKRPADEESTKKSHQY